MIAPIWIRERDIRLDFPRAIALLRAAMHREAAGIARNMTKTHLDWAGGALHAIGAAFTDTHKVGAKVWAHTPGGATPLEILWDSRTGGLLAIIEAFGMGQFRTAGMAGLATDQLARPDADTFAIIGTGKQALAQVAAVKSVRGIRAVRIYGRSAEKRAAFAENVRSLLDLTVECFADVGAAVAGASIVTVVTRATEPLLTADMVSRGTHINAMGAITPERREVASNLIDRCAVVAVDSVDQARLLSSELKPLFDDPKATTPLCSLSDLVASGYTRPADADLTMFKSLGVGVADLALAEAVYEFSRARQLGVELPIPQPTQISFEPITAD